ncbi:MAG: substrate-binding domain-containing protein [Bacteroidia bacterium]|jgi:phosphate transport system substrate-binding protein
MLKLKKYLSFFICSVFVGSLVNCSSGPHEATDTPTSGEVNIVVDESFSQLFDTQIYTFHALYKNATVKALYLPEKDALQRLIDDSCKVVVMCRDLTATERQKFEKANIFPISTKIAEDAIAIIVNNENTDTVMTVDRVKSILNGNDSLWSQLNKTSQLGKINIVFDNNGSANTSYMRDTLLQGQSFSKNAFAVKSNPEVIDYVSQHKNAIGVLSVNWISDRDDTLTTNFMKKIKLVAIAKDESSKAVKPYQAYIKTKDYPFTRSVYMISRQTRAGLGMGFVSFVAGEKGQIMILKAGLVPAVAPVRLIEVNMQ